MLYRVKRNGKHGCAVYEAAEKEEKRELTPEAEFARVTKILEEHGLLRKNEGEEVAAVFSGRALRFLHIHAEDRFLARLAGVTDPEAKRRIIGETFIRVFEEVGRDIGAVDFLAQGTIYPDVIESGAGEAAVIKSHHNVGGLPDCVDFKEILEPLRMLFKDEVRELGRTLGLPEELVSRQPFPGPGLAIRVIGEVTKEKLALLREPRRSRARRSRPRPSTSRCSGPGTEKSS